MIRLALACASIWVAMLIGWCYAHVTVATECQRLGSFYVGKNTFKCVEVGDKE